MKLLITKDTANVTLLVFVQDSSSTTGDGLTGIVAADLSAYFARVEDDNDVTITEISLSDLSGTGTDHGDGGWEEISPNMPGWYRFDIPDAAVATGARSCGISLVDAASNDIAQVTIEIQLTDVDLEDSVRGGMTALPNAAAEAAGGLYTRGSGAGQINQNANGQVDTRAVAISDGIIVAATLGGDCITAAKIADSAFVADNFAASSLNGKGDWNTTVPDAAGTVPVDGTLKVDIETIKTQAVTCAAGVTVGVYVGSTAAAAIASDVTTAHSTTDGLVTTVDTVVDGIKSVTDNLPDSGALNDLSAILIDTGVIGTGGVGLDDLGGMSTAMKAEILSEVNDALDTAISELGVAAPTATPTVRTGLMLLYMALRNQLIVQTSGTDALEIYNDADTKIAAKLLSDDGSDYTEAQMS